MPLRVPAPISLPLTITVEQPDETQLLVQAIPRFNGTYFKALPHDTLTVVWTPASGLSPHITSILVSVEAAGICYLYKNDEEFMRMEFNERKSQPFGVAADIHFDADTVINAKFTGDAATPSGYITIVGHEHEP